MERCHWCLKESAESERPPDKWSTRNYCARCNEFVKEGWTGVTWRRHFLEWMDHPDRKKEWEEMLARAGVGDRGKAIQDSIAAIKVVGYRMMQQSPERGRDFDSTAPSVARRTKTFAQQSFEDRERWYADRKAIAADHDDGP